MIGGVNFQPGMGQGGEQSQAQPSAGSGVQEAIKVLSLRLPKVVGAQAAAPMALLSGQGSGGSRVDSVVNQILSRIMPTGQPQQTPMANLSAPSQQPTPMPSWPWMPQQQEQPWQTAPKPPRVTIGNPPTWGTDADMRMPGERGTPPGMFMELPGTYTPEPNLELIGRLLGGAPSTPPPDHGGREETPLF